MQNTNRRYRDVAVMLRQQLRQQNYRAGDRLPPERQLAADLFVSRSLLREALIMLEIEGVVEVRPGSGVYVSQSLSLQQLASHNTAESIEEAMDDSGPFEMLQARQIIESSVAEAAAWQVSKTDIDAMQQTLDNERLAVSRGIVEYDSDKQFHLLIAEATQNSVLVDCVTRLWQQRENSAMWRQLHKRIADDSYRVLWADEHQNILNALKRKSPTQAKRAMWSHLEHVRNTLFELSESDSPDFDGYLFPIPPLSDVSLSD